MRSRSRSPAQARSVPAASICACIDADGLILVLIFFQISGQRSPKKTPKKTSELTPTELDDKNKEVQDKLQVRHTTPSPCASTLLPHGVGLFVRSRH